MADHIRPVRSATEPRLYRCDACGIVDTWGPSWSWYGTIDAEVDLTVCSSECIPIAEATLPLSKRLRRG